MCDSCDTFDVEVAIHGPQQFRRIVDKVRRAIEAGSLACNEFESSRALMGQARFSDLDLTDHLPDVMQYYFDCRECRSSFSLMVEAYHGQGGKWSRL